MLNINKQNDLTHISPILVRVTRPIRDLNVKQNKLSTGFYLISAYHTALAKKDCMLPVLVTDRHGCLVGFILILCAFLTICSYIYIYIYIYIYSARPKLPLAICRHTVHYYSLVVRYPVASKISQKDYYILI